MSDCTHIACHDCEVSLWIGQQSPDSRRIYLDVSGMTMEILEKFLYAHVGHRLEFNGDQSGKFDYFKTICPDCGEDSEICGHE